MNNKLKLLLEYLEHFHFYKKDHALLLSKIKHSPDLTRRKILGGLVGSVLLPSEVNAELLDLFGSSPWLEASQQVKLAAANASKKKRKPIIAIDAGHGGKDPGAIGKNGTKEKHITLSIAKKLKEKINATDNLRGVLIREADYAIALKDRVLKAHNARADLFISIHADAFSKPNTFGSSVYALSENGASSAAASWLADKENNADIILDAHFKTDNRDLAKTILSLKQEATIRESVELGWSMLKEIRAINKLHRERVEQAEFAVLKSPEIPSILIETAFLSNPDEEVRLREGWFQTSMANAIVGGIQRYFTKNPPVAESTEQIQLWQV